MSAEEQAKEPRAERKPDGLTTDIESIVEDALGDHSVRQYRSEKVIHDAVHGSNVFKPHEVAALDLPLVQRLRRIRQLGMALHVYPAGSHSRFEHSLGVAVMAGKLMDALEARKQATIPRGRRNEVRLAAILHDIGHLPFSHITEEVLNDKETFPEIGEALARAPTDKPHELFSALMIRTRAFERTYLKPMRERYADEFADVDIERVSQLIMGEAPAEDQYLARIISGVLDADKMDYILRDCHMTGLKMSVDVDRILQTILVAEYDGRQTLAVDMTGVSTIEQLLFDKLLLNMSVYHHQKVRATECIIKSIYERAIRNGVELPRIGKITGVNLLRYVDDDLLSLEHFTADSGLAKLVRRLTQRDLLMRIVEIARRLVERSRSRPAAFDRFLDLPSQPARVFAYRKALSDELHTDVYETWIDCPREIKLKEAANFPVVRRGAPTTTLDEVFPIEDWLGSFNQMKYRGHVFVPVQALTDGNYVRITQFLQDELGLALKAESRAAGVA